MAKIRDALIAIHGGVTDDASAYAVLVGAKNPDIDRVRGCRARYENVRLDLAFEGS